MAQAGFRTLTFDFRGYGESGGEKDVAAIDRDMEGAYRYLIGRKIRPVYLVGASMGGTAALIVAARVPVPGVATLSAPATFAGLDAAAAVANWAQRPGLVAATLPFLRQFPSLLTWGARLSGKARVVVPQMAASAAAP
jgi:pimeloyl-ACP methyl ester carboxylesterase